MSAALEAQAEITKLAQLLEVEPGSLAYLEKVPPDDLRRVREQTTDLLFNADRRVLQRMAAASRLVPVPLLAKIAEGAFGPLLCARIAGLIDTPRAVDIATRLRPSFLADVAVLLDPRRASDLIARLLPEQIAAVAGELIARAEYVTMGRFVAHLSDDALAAAVGLIDAPSLLHVAFVIEGKERLGQVLGLLSRERLEEVIDVAAREDLWPEALDLLGNVSSSASRELAGRELGDSVASVDEALATLAAVAARLDRELLERAASAASEHRLWPPLIALAALMDETGQRRVADLIASGPDAVIETFFDAVDAAWLWHEVLTIASRLERTQTEQLARRGAARIDLIALATAAEQDERLWEPGLRLLAGLDEHLQRQVIERAAELSKAQLTTIGEHTRRLGLADQLAPFAELNA